MLACVPAVSASAGSARLDPHNVQVPFCYQPGGPQSWRIATGTLSDGQRVELELLHGKEHVASGSGIDARGLLISVSRGPRLV